MGMVRPYTTQVSHTYYSSGAVMESTGKKKAREAQKYMETRPSKRRQRHWHEMAASGDRSTTEKSLEKCG